LILLLAVILGLPAGLIRASINNRKYHLPELRWLGLVIGAFLLQAVAFNIPSTRERIPDAWAAAILITSQAALLVFAWVNRRQPGFWALSLGLALNFLVITLNGGWMPISPETLMRRSPDAPPGSWEIGERLGVGKDKVLPEAETTLWLLSDRFTTPAQFPYHVAFSLGDVWIAIGAFLLLWSIGAPVKE
jgi:hypothetical protein